MEEIDLKELFKVFWDRKVQIFLIVSIFIMLGVIYTIGFVEPEYSASTTLLLASTNKNLSTDAMDSAITASDITVNSKLVSTYSELIKSKNILSTVISNLNIDIGEEALKRSIKVSAVKDTEVIKITVTNESPKVAATIANEVAKVFIDKVKEEFYKIENVHVVDVAEINEEPSNIHPERDIILFAGIGVIMGGIYALLAYMMDTTVKTPEEIESVYQLPVLATIPVYEESLQKTRKGKYKK